MSVMWRYIDYGVDLKQIGYGYQYDVYLKGDKVNFKESTLTVLMIVMCIVTNTSLISVYTRTQVN